MKRNKALAYVSGLLALGLAIGSFSFATEKVEYSQTINAPLTGTFYSTPGQGKERFVKEGDIVNAGDKVCIVEAMKLFNPINAAVKCKIVKFIAKDGQGVEKGQPLIGIEPV